MDVKYYSSTGYISSIDMSSATLYFDRTSVKYVAEVFDENASTQAFNSNTELLMCATLIMDGKMLITNNLMYR